MKIQTLLLSIAGIITLLCWVVGSATAFWFLLSSTPQGVTNDSVAAVAWPFVFILVTMPALAIILVGGLRTLGQVLSLREFLNELPDQVRAFEKLAEQMNHNRQQFEDSKESIEQAAGIIDETSGLLANFEARISGMNERLRDAGSASPIGLGDETNLVDELNGHLEHAKQLFDDAAEAYQQKRGEDVDRAKGWILQSAIDDLRQHGFLTENDAQYVDVVISIERRTRRSGRKNLSNDDISKMNAMRPT